MLEVKKINKSYKSKKGSDCHAIRDVSIDFGNKGLIFILGKSGSGKSTFLNLISGLDSVDSGEIIIANKSSKEFTQSDFDIYRNTYVGFVFQDFSILDELNIKENIALSLELQGKKVTDEQINAALHQVDLEGYEHRKPNELSGGQKQRIAIARALIKDPKIIFADEPTGNLDSKTSRAVLEAFKKLSKDRLVIVVSHDVDSALIYADRIIELKDGKVFEDRTKTKAVDLQTIKNEYQQKIDSCFAATQKEPTQKPEFVKIKTKLPAKAALKMSFSSFGMKKIKFAFTMIITILALAIFCILLNIRDYDYFKASISTFENLDINTLMVTKYKTLTPEELEELGEFEDPPMTYFLRTDVSRIETAAPGALFKVFRKNINVDEFSRLNEEWARYSTRSRSIVESCSSDFNESILNGFYHAKLLLGDYPKLNTASPDIVEVLISDYLADSFLHYGVEFDGGIVYPNSNRSNLIGQTYQDSEVTYKIVGIYSTDYNTLHVERRMTLETRFKMEYNYTAILTARNALGNCFMSESVFSANISINMPNLGEDTSFNSSINFLKAEKAEDIVFDLPVFFTPTVKYINGYSAETVLSANEVIISWSKFIDLNMLYVGETPVTFADLDVNDYKNTVYWTSFNAALEDMTVYGLKIVGVFDDSNLIIPNLPGYPTAADIANTFVVNENTFEAVILDNMVLVTLMAEINPAAAEQNEVFLKYLSDNGFGHMTYASRELKSFNMLFSYILDFFDMAALVLFVLVFLLIYNFISSSINAKRKDIGILRAMGARGLDIAKIFAFEGLLISVICILFSSLLTLIGVFYVNLLLTSRLTTPLSIVILNPISLIIMALTCLLVVFVASTIPLVLIVKEKPIDSIKEK